MANPVTVPVPATWTSGPVRAPLLRANVSDAVALLSRPPMFAGQQTVTSQVIPASTTTQVALDTEVYDNYAGHLTTVNQSEYFCKFPGWYLCEASVPYPAVAGGGSMSGIVAGIQNGGTLHFYGGSLLATNTGHAVAGSASKLMLLTHTSADWAGSAVFGPAATLPNTASLIPSFQARWVCAQSGTEPLAVPANPAWAVPPSIVTSAFLNANIRDAIRFLIYPPIMEASYNGSGSLASQAAPPATGTTVGCGLTVVDNYSAYNGTTWTAPVAGVYYCYGCVAGTAGANGAYLAAGLTITSSNYNSGTTFTSWGGTATVTVSAANAAITRRKLRLNAGDTVALAGFQNDTGAANVTFLNSGTWVSRFITCWRSA